MRGAGRSRWGEATDEPAREDACPTNCHTLRLVLQTQPRSGHCPPQLLQSCFHFTRLPRVALVARPARTSQPRAD